jgi:hypothetical protein
MSRQFHHPELKRIGYYKCSSVPLGIYALREYDFIFRHNVQVSAKKRAGSEQMCIGCSSFRGKVAEICNTEV